MVYEQLSDTFIEKTKENYKYIMLTSLTLPCSPFHKSVSCIKASSRETKMGRGSLHLNKQTNCWKPKVSGKRAEEHGDLF